MTDQKRVIVLANDSYGGIQILSAPDDVVIVIKDYDVPEGVVEDRGGDYANDQEITELFQDDANAGQGGEWGLEVDRENPLPNGRFPITHYQKHLLTATGQYRPSIPVEHYDSFRAEDKPERDALYEQYAKPL